MIRILILFMFAYILFPAVSRAQGDASNPVVAEIIRAYNQFDYPETDRLLKLALAEAQNYSPQDRLTIFQYAAFRQFQQGNPFQAESYFWNMLEIDPNYNPDPLLTPPKLLTLFQNTKVKFLEDLKQRLGKLEVVERRQPLPWRSAVFPGWEQWHRGYRAKGAIWAIAGIGTLGGALQAVIRTRQKEEDYQNAQGSAEIRQKYDDYNRAYQSQFYWSYAFAAVWLSSHFDALFFSPIKPRMELSVYSLDRQPLLRVALHF